MILISEQLGPQHIGRDEGKSKLVLFVALVFAATYRKMTIRVERNWVCLVVAKG